MKTITVEITFDIPNDADAFANADARVIWDAIRAAFPSPIVSIVVLGGRAELSMRRGNQGGKNG